MVIQETNTVELNYINCFLDMVPKIIHKEIRFIAYLELCFAYLEFEFGLQKSTLLNVLRTDLLKVHPDGWYNKKIDRNR